MKNVYADNAATTRLSDAAFEAMLPFLKENYGNASSIYKLGRISSKALDEARSNVASAIGADPSEIIFTGGGSEADNLALKGTAFAAFRTGKKHLISTKFEHHAVLEPLEMLKRQGFEITLVDVDEKGLVDIEAIANAIREDTIIVSVMAANNEIGTIQDIAKLGALCRSRGVLFHTDAVQAVGHIPIDVKAMQIDLLSMSGHKFHGPKGVGALYARKGVKFIPLIDGGGQEKKRRSGTENIAGIVGMAAALTEAVSELESESKRLSGLRDRLIAGMLKMEGVALTGHPTQRLPGVASFTVSRIEGEAMVLLLDVNGIAASSGSACSTGSLDPSHVLMSIGLTHEVAHGSVRFSFGKYNTEEDIDYIIESMKTVVERLRFMTPLK